MDEKDIFLIKRLSTNSRAPYRELAEAVGLSVDAVHKRIQRLVDSGIIAKFYTNIRFDHLGAIGVTIFGKSEAVAMEEAIRSLGESEYVYGVHVTGGGQLYVLGVLRDIGDLGGLTDLVRETLQMDEPTVGIAEPLVGVRDDVSSLTNLDYRIIQALHEDSRKPIAEVSAELGVSSKTVSRHLAKMEEDQVIGFGIDFVPTAEHDILAYFHMTLGEGTTPREAMVAMVNKYPPHLLGALPMSNLPNFLFCSVWARTMKELKGLQRKFEREGLFKRVVPNIFYDAYLFETWRDSLLREKALGPSGDP